ncbi:MAG: DNA translocase FtsK 4TM domain-containing protein, partial [Pseudomonadota bacterium]|nr:DNA translocase FtsK 4TM domain-containing protein [Pseudomonadota bacterium]
YVADLLLQVFGITSFFLPILFIAWGWRLVKSQKILLFWARSLVAVSAIVMFAAFLAVSQSSEHSALYPGLGGITGFVVYKTIISFLEPFQFGYSVHFVGGFSFITGLLAAIFAIGLEKSEWTQIFRVLHTILQSFSRTGKVLLKFSRAAKQDKIEPQFAHRENGRDGKISPNERGLSSDSVTLQNRKRPSKDIVEEKLRRTKTGAKAKMAQQGNLRLTENEDFQLPPLELLEAPLPPVITKEADKGALSQNAQVLESVLDDFGIKGEIVKVRPGPVVTLYELEPAPGTKTSRVVGLSDDIARSMSALSVRIAVIPGRSVIGIELPNAQRDMVYFRELLGSAACEKSKGSLTLVLGKDIGGSPSLVDLARMPHLLIAGTTGSGKSVAINTMICSLLYRLTPDQCKFIMIDPKMLELSVYEGIPNLLTPVVTDPTKAVFALKWAVREMEDRYRLMSQLGVRNISGYNARLYDARKRGEDLSRSVQTGFDNSGTPIFENQTISTDPLPLIVIVVDEMADLMMVAGKDIEAAIQRLAQMARAAGIHLIMATQRPSVDVITGTIKANFPTRISFQVTSKIDSRTILGEQGAEQLLGQGDMLYMAGGGQITRVHGPFVSDEEVEKIVSYLKTQAEPKYIEEITTDLYNGSQLSGEGSPNSPEDSYYDEALALVAREGKASTSFIQRHLQIGYNRAARIIERMESDGVVSKADRVGRREVLVSAQ